VFDDIGLILDNPAVKHLENIPSRFTSGIENIPYRPLRGISFTIDYQFTGLNPAGYHISNIIFHVLTTLLVYWIIAVLTRKPRVAFLAACLFAVHPVHTDSVAYISGRRDILSTLFYLLGFYLFLLSRHKGKPGFLIAALVSYLLAVSSKEMAVTLPAIFFLYDCIHNLSDEGPLSSRCSVSIKKVITRYGFFYLSFLTVAILFTCYKVFLKSPSTKLGFYGGDFFIQFLTVGKILVHYIKLLFYPVNLLADYSFNSFPLSQSFFEPATLLSLIVLCGLGLLTVKLLLSNRLMAFAVLWFFVTLLPVCHIFPHHELLAEHYLYLPSFGFVLLVALILERLLNIIRWRYAVYIVFALLIVVLSARTVNRNYDWKDSFSIWSKTVKTAPNCARALSNLGIEYFNRKEYTQAEQLYQRAIKVRPGQDKPYHNLGNLYRKKKDYGSALVMYQKAAQLNSANCTHYNSLGHAYAMVKRYEEAVKAFEHALECNPDYAEAFNNLGNVYRGLRETERAITCYQKAIQLNPYYADAYHNLAKVFGDLNQHEKSIQILKGLLSKNPFLPDTVIRLGRVFEKTDQYDQAIIRYENVLKLQPASPEAHTGLGRVYEQQGLYQQAIAHYQKALAINPGFLDPHLNLARLYLEQFKDKQKALYYLKLWLAETPQDARAVQVRKMIDQIEKGRVD
jgi:tetratricopeptide (TPR) repeat protein